MKKLRIIDKWMVMVAIVSIAFLMGCGKSAKEGENVPDESKDNKEVVTESADAQDESESADVDEDLPEGLDSMTSGLADTPITVSPKGAKVNIQDFAQAFCSQYDRYEPNEKILKLHQILSIDRSWPLNPNVLLEPQKRPFTGGSLHGEWF